MSPWPALVAIALLALVLAVLVGRAVAASGERRTLVSCPYTGFAPLVRITRAGLAEALGRPGLRRVEDCPLSPGRILCRQACLKEARGRSRPSPA